MKKPSSFAPAQKLDNATLSSLSLSVLRPQYDRSQLTAGILHIGVGNFHRAHQAWYLHRLMQMGQAKDWAIVGAGVRPYDAGQREKLLAQDCLSTLIELDPAGTSAEVVGSMIDYVPISPNNAALIDRMTQPDIRIVSLTVTEGGYFVDPVTNEFDASHPDIRHDIANPRHPKTVFGAIVAALKVRHARGIGPFTGLCCDNLQGNGTILRQNIVSLARLSDPDLAEWIDTTCTFPNSMVDCIVPSTGQQERDTVRSLGIDDAVPVTHEKFRQWVIEDAFCAGRPDWDLVGATFANNVHDFEAMKIRILNGGHQVIANVGELLGLATVADCMSHKLVGDLFQKVTRQEIAPLVKAVPGMAPDTYVDLIAQRFSNTKIVDTVRRVAFDGSSRHPGFLVPTIRHGLERGTPVEGLALVEAAWARMCEGRREDGSIIEANDPHWVTLQSAACNSKSDPAIWLAQSQYYGDLAKSPIFSMAFAKWLTAIHQKGIEICIKDYLA
jgi:mannitol 2-dehydrogenase